jgi:hypothetical protein
MPRTSLPHQLFDDLLLREYVGRSVMPILLGQRELLGRVSRRSLWAGEEELSEEPVLGRLRGEGAKNVEVVRSLPTDHFPKEEMIGIFWEGARSVVVTEGGKVCDGLKGLFGSWQDDEDVEGRLGRKARDTGGTDVLNRQRGGERLGEDFPLPLELARPTGVVGHYLDGPLRAAVAGYLLVSKPFEVRAFPCNRGPFRHRDHPASFQARTGLRQPKRGCP